MKIEFQDVSWKRRKFSLQHISLEVKEGYITGLVGKNGAGKTTLFRTLLDEDAKYSGKIYIDGKELRSHRKELLNRIGVVSEEQPFLKEKSAIENVKLLGKLYHDFSEEIFCVTMRRMGLATGKLIKNMSRGEFLKFQLAFALAHGATLFLLDEVTAGMDVVFKKEFFCVLHDMLRDEGCTVFMSTHIQEEIQQHMDYLARLEEGCLVAYYEVGTQQDIVDSLQEG